jgi:hypothetical protein
MAQYWIQIPVENAKEVVQRKIDELVALGTLPDYAGYTVSYDENCEVVLDGNYLMNQNSYFDSNIIYFGTFVANLDYDFGASPSITDINYNNYNPFNWIDNPPKAGNYPYIIWNLFNLDDFGGYQGYFFGYKLTLTPPAV